MKILLTDAGQKHTVGIARHLRRSGHMVGVCGPGLLEAAFYSTAVRRRHRTPPPAEAEAFARAVLELGRRYRYELVIPVGYYSVVALSRCRDCFGSRLKCILPPAEALAIAADKVRANEAARAAGVGAPRTWTPVDTTDLAKTIRELQFPVIIKGRLERSVISTTYARDAPELEKHLLAGLKRTRSAGEPPPIVQERIVGPGVGFFACYDRGECKRRFMHRRIREMPPSGGFSTCAESFVHQELAASGQRMLDSLRWHGVAMVEFKLRQSNGRPVLMEINPKFWGSTELALAAGADFPGDLVRLARGERLKPCTDYRRNLRYCWPLNSDFQHLIRVRSARRKVLADWLDARVKKNLLWSDPCPTVVMGGIALVQVIRGNRS